MPSLKDMLDFMCECARQTGHSFDSDFAEQIEMQIRKQWPAERVYIQPATSRKDPRRGHEIRETARKLPTNVMAERYGISRQLIAYHVKKGKNPAG